MSREPVIDRSRPADWRHGKPWLVALILAMIAALLVLTLNPLTMLLSPIALFLAAIYPYSKRWIQIPQAVLGIAFGWGVIMAWAASRGTLDPPAWWLFGATICWAIAYDTIYALQDREDDRRIGVKSSAILFGEAVPAAVGLFLSAMVVCLVSAGQGSGLRMEYYLVLALLGGLFWWQVRRLKASVTPHIAFRLFHQHVYAGVVILLGIWWGTWTVRTSRIPNPSISLALDICEAYRTQYGNRCFDERRTTLRARRPMRRLCAFRGRTLATCRQHRPAVCSSISRLLFREVYPASGREAFSDRGPRLSRRHH